MIVEQPMWLLLLIPLWAVWRFWRLPTRPLQFLRAVILTLIVLALSRPIVKLPTRGGTVVVLADRSSSMPDDGRTRQMEALKILQENMRKHDRLGVVSFGARAIVEQAPQTAAFPGFAAEVGTDDSHLAEAIETALTLIPEGEAGRLLVLSDGRWTGRDPVRAATRAAARRVSIDHRLIERRTTGDLGVDRLETPGEVSEGQSYMMRAWILSPVQQDIRYSLVREGTTIASGTLNLRSGVSPLTFRDIAGDAGTYEYTLKIEGDLADPLPQNNEARFLVGVRGTKPVLVASGRADSGLAALLQKSGVETRSLAPPNLSFSLAALSDYSAVILENLAAEYVGPDGMENLAAWVEESGGGLMLTGGKDAYGPGGYFKSPLDRILPVSMELRREHRKLMLAIVVALDRSGSMAASATGGKTKMDLANIGTVQVLDLLAPQDEFGVIAVDSAPHTIVDLDAVEFNASKRGDILHIDSMGGGIFIYEALHAAAAMLADAAAETRHIILFADAADSEEPGAYVQLLSKCRAANVSVSVIGLGTPADVDAGLLRDIARRGNGRCFFTQDAMQIPRLFAQDTFAVARSSFVEDTTRTKFTQAFNTISDLRFDLPPAIGGYNLCYLRPGAAMSAHTEDEYKAPVIASWHAGGGRVLCYTGEADGEYTGPLEQWPQAGRLFTSLARWTTGEKRTLPDDMLLVGTVYEGLCTVELHLDPERERDPFTIPPEVRFVRGRTGGKPAVDRIPMRWTDADLLVAETPLGGSDTVLPSVQFGEAFTLQLPPVCLPYSQEYRPCEEGKGEAALRQLGKITLGEERLDLAGMWKHLPRTTRRVDVASILLLAAVILFLLEVLQRRTGMLTRQRLPVERRPAPEPAEPAPRTRRRRRQPKTPKESAKPQPEKKVPEAESQADTFSALRDARRRAQRRTRR